MAVVRSDYDYAVFSRHFKNVHTRNCFLNLKDKNYKKAKMKGELCWMKKNIGNDSSSLFNGNHFPSIYIYDSRLNRPESVSLASLARQ